MAKGLVVILTGASSVGKGKIRDLLLADEELKLFFSRRPGRVRKTKSTAKTITSFPINSSQNL